MTDWPATLPVKFLKGSYDEEIGDTVVKTSMEVGPAKRRPRSSISVDYISGSFILSLAQRNTLVDFYKNDVKRTLKFNFFHELWNQTIEVIFDGPPRFAAHAAPGKFIGSVRFEIQE